MDRLTGVVMEITGKHVVLLTARGEFKRVRIAGRIPDIGDEISIPVAHRRFFNMPKAGWMAVAAAVILLVVASPLLTMFTQPPEVAVAYVSIDINPSVELTVGSRYHVLDARPFNTDGKKVLDELDLRGMQYEEAVSAIKQKAEELGYLKKTSGNTVVVSVAFLNDAETDLDLVGKSLIAAANSVFNDDNIRLATINVPSKISEKARQKGISTGKYAVLIEAVTNGVPVTEENIQEKPITVAISEAGGQPEDIIGRAVSENQFDVKLLRYLDISDNAGSKPAVVAANEGTNVSVQTGDVNGNGSMDGDNKSKQGKNKFVEPIRNNRSPEDTQDFSGQTAAGSDTKPAAATAPIQPAEPGGGTGEGKPVDNQKPGVPTVPTTPTDNISGDTNTSDNYMGPDDSDSGPKDANQDMWRLKPNF